MAEVQYKRLTWSRRRRQPGFAAFSSARSSLWLAKDHLLCIDTTGYTETYKRFYLRDVQALVLRRTSRLLVTGVVLGVIICLLILAAILPKDLVAAYIFGSLAALVLLVLVVHLARGPTCVCHLRTAVQTEELPSLNRLWRARKVLNRLRPLIAAAQGELAPEEIQARMQALTQAPAGAPAATPAPVVVDDPNAPPRIV